MESPQNKKEITDILTVKRQWTKNTKLYVTTYTLLMKYLLAKIWLYRNEGSWG